jgi:hypothetical protein
MPSNIKRSVDPQLYGSRVINKHNTGNWFFFSIYINSFRRFSSIETFKKLENLNIGDMIMRSNFMRSKLPFFMRLKFLAKLIMRSKLAFFRRSKLFVKLIRRLKRP